MIFELLKYQIKEKKDVSKGHHLPPDGTVRGTPPQRGGET